MKIKSGALVLSVICLIGCQDTDTNTAEESAVEAQPPTASIERLNDTFLTPGYASDRAAVDGLTSAFQAADQARMQQVWSRMLPAQKLLAYDTIREWVKDLEDEDYEVVDEAYQLLKRVDWNGVYAENEAIKATADLVFGNLRGKVLNPDTNEPVQGMEISASHLEHGLGPKMSTSKTRAVTDTEGRFELTHIPVGEIVIIGLQSNYVLDDATAEILADETLEQTYVAKSLAGR